MKLKPTILIVLAIAFSVFCFGQENLELNVDTFQFNTRVPDIEYWQNGDLYTGIRFFDAQTKEQIHSTEQLDAVMNKNGGYADLLFSYAGINSTATVSEPKYSFELNFSKNHIGLIPESAMQYQDQSILSNIDIDTRQERLVVAKEDEVPDMWVVNDFESLINLDDENQGNTYDFTIDSQISLYLLKGKIAGGIFGFGPSFGFRYTWGGQDEIPDVAFSYWAWEANISVGFYYYNPEWRFRLIFDAGYYYGEERDKDLFEPNQFRLDDYEHTLHGVGYHLEAQIVDPFGTETFKVGNFKFLDRFRLVSQGLYAKTNDNGEFDDDEERDFFKALGFFGLASYKNKIGDVPVTVELFAVTGVDIFRRDEDETKADQLNYDYRLGGGLNITFQFKYWNVSIGYNWYRGFFPNDTEPDGDYNHVRNTNGFDLF